MASFMDKVANFGEKTKLNSQIRDMERHKQALFTNAGNLVFNLYSSGNVDIPECTGIFEQIKSIDEGIANIKKQINRLDQAGMQNMAYMQGQMQNGVMCPCGMMNMPGSRFCAKCGQPIVENTSPQSYVQPEHKQPAYPSQGSGQQSYESRGYTQQEYTPHEVSPPEPVQPDHAPQDYDKTLAVTQQSYKPGAAGPAAGRCPVCGYQNHPGVAFCGGCGTKIG